MKLKTKFLILSFIFLTITVFITTEYMSRQYTALYNTQMTQMIDNTINKAVSNTEKAILDINNTTYLFQTDAGNSGTLMDTLKSYNKNPDEFTSYDLYTARQYIKHICQNFLFINENINGIFVLLPNNQSFGWGNGIDISYNYDPTSDGWYQETLSLHGKLYISEISNWDFILRSEESLFFSKALYDIYSNEFLGIVLIDCNPTLFDISETNVLPDSLYLNIHKTDNTNCIYYNNIDDIDTSFFRYNDKNRLSRVIDLENFPITVQAQISFNNFSKQLLQTRLKMFGLAFMLLLLLTLIHYPFSSHILNPITKLASYMHNHHLEKPPFSAKYILQKDEIGMLYKEYNTMIDSLNEYIKKDYQNKLITLDAQMRALEAQIDAHFLFNTLETMNSIAEIEEVTSISTISMALGNMFRYSIKTKSELVTLRDELNHVKDYISIQSIRFDNRFSISYEIPTDLLDLKVLKLILQPVVENAINHGFKHCSISGHISVSAHREGHDLLFVIADTGIGMNPVQLENLTDQLNAETTINELGHRTSQNIGLKNIHSRIRLY